MPDPAVAAFVDRIVAGARIPGRARRDDLRRELYAHFEDAGTSPEALADAVRRFGSEALLTDAWQRVYRRDYALLYAAKVGLSIVVSIAVALAIQLLVNLRVGLTAEIWRLAPGFSYSAPMSAALVVGFVTAWELGRPPVSWMRAAAAVALFAAVCVLAEVALASGMRGVPGLTVLVALGYWCSRLKPRLWTVALAVAVFAAAEYGIHQAASVDFGATRAIRTGAVFASIWACTLVILARADDAFVSWFGALNRRAGPRATCPATGRPAS
jgi:hypothetical protein